MPCGAAPSSALLWHVQGSHVGMNILREGPFWTSEVARNSCPTNTLAVPYFAIMAICVLNIGDGFEGNPKSINEGVPNFVHPSSLWSLWWYRLTGPPPGRKTTEKNNKK